MGKTKSSMIEKVIEIKCGGETYLDFYDLNQLQGKLKTISKEDFDKLKKSLIKSGITIGFHAWRDSTGKAWTIDGTHRVLALHALKKDGYLVPKIPVNFVKAKTKKEAALAILVANSKYAHMSEESISDFAIDFELEIEDFQFLDLPEVQKNSIDMDQQRESTNQKEKEKTEHICPSCGLVF